MLIKSRKGKNSERGFYSQDIELRNTVFQPGTKYKYVLDTKNNTMIVLPSESEEDNTVSKRVIKDGVKPVIDIRSKEVLSAFEGCDYLQIEIHDDQILVQGFVEEKQSLLSKVANSAKNLFKKNKKVVDITQLINVKKKVEIVLPLHELRAAVGQTNFSFEQLTFDFSYAEQEFSNSTILDIQSKLKNLHIPLEVAAYFSGAGLMDRGFLDAGFKVLFALEIDKHAVQTYRENNGNHVVEMDIMQADKSKLPKMPVMIGGSSCKPFSNVNRIKRLLDHPDSRLLVEFIETIKANENCQVFVLENVPEILTANEGAFKDEIYNALPEFQITSGILNSADFGSPMIRKRAFFIGSKIGEIPLPTPIYKPDEYRTVKDAFAGLHNGVPNQMDITRSKPDVIERMKYVPQGGNFKDIPKELCPRVQQSNYHKRLDWNKPSVSIVNPRKVLLTHPEENRVVSVRECARLFDLKDDFVFKGTLNAMQQQICNAVPVKLAQAIAKTVKNAIERFNISMRNNLVPQF